jgi:hypothetical protein
MTAKDQRSELRNVDVTLEKGIRELSSAEMAAHRDYVHAEARERISGIGGALRLSLNNMTVGSLREYIALSRHQLEMSEYVNGQTAGTQQDPVSLELINWPDCQYYPFEPAQGPRSDESKVSPAWEVEQIRDVMWRVKAVGGVLGRSGNRLVATDADGLTELSNHQCEIADFMRTGKFRKVPRRRKARYLGGDGTQSAETARRVRELGEALKEYQGCITIKTVREFIALSKHQCELAGMVMASEREMKKTQTIELVHYGDAYPNAVDSSEKATTLDTPVKPEYDINKEEEHGFNSSYSGLTGVSRGSVRYEKTTILDAPIRSEHDGNKEMNHSAGSGLRPEPDISDRQQAQGTGAPVHEQRFVGNEISGAGRGRLVPSYKPAPAKESSEQSTTLSLHGIIRHPSGVPAENIRVQVDIGVEEPRIISLDEITDREGRFTRERAWSYRLVPRFESGEAIRPPDNIIVRGELFNRVMREPLRDAEVHITLGGGSRERTFGAVTDFKGQFTAGEVVSDPCRVTNSNPHAGGALAGWLDPLRQPVRRARPC